jgi:hypothetical protein
LFGGNAPFFAVFDQGRVIPYGRECRKPLLRASTLPVKKIPFLGLGESGSPVGHNPFSPLCGSFVDAQNNDS